MSINICQTSSIVLLTPLYYIVRLKCQTIIEAIALKLGMFDFDADRLLDFTKVTTPNNEAVVIAGLYCFVHYGTATCGRLVEWADRLEGLVTDQRRSISKNEREYLSGCRTEYFAEWGLTTKATRHLCRSDISGRFSAASESEKDAGPVFDIFDLQSKLTRFYIKIITT